MTAGAPSDGVDHASTPLLEMRGDIGMQAVDLGNEILNGKTPAQPTTLIAPKLVTRDNVGQYHGW